MNEQELEMTRCTTEGVLPKAEDYVVEEISNLETQPVEFYRLPVTEEEISVLNKITTKECRLRETRVMEHLPIFVDFAATECLDVSVSDHEIDVFKSVLSKVIQDYNDKLGINFIHVTSAKLVAIDVDEECFDRIYRYNLDNIRWHNDFYIEYPGNIIGDILVSTLALFCDTNPQRLTADLSFTNIHTEFLNQEVTKTLSDSNKCSFTLRGDHLFNSSDPGCNSMLPKQFGSPESIKAPSGPYASHFRLNSIHTAPEYLTCRKLFLLLDTEHLFSLQHLLKLLLPSSWIESETFETEETRIIQ